ncbi:MAG: S9 family peptidase, partial [Planctomycetota bacterium]
GSAHSHTSTSFRVLRPRRFSPATDFSQIHMSLILSLALLAPGVLPQADADSAPSSGLERRSLEPMDLFQLEGIASPKVSPDGTKILYLRTMFDVMSDSSYPDLWIHDVETGDSRPLIAAVGGAEWSPDGKHIAYVKMAEDDGAEIFVRWMDDGTTHQVTRANRSPGSISWSPDGQRIAFQMSVQRESKSLAELPSPPKGAKWAPAMKVIERFSYRGDGQGYKENTDTHLFVVDAFGGTPVQLTNGERDHGGPLVWIDDNTILFSANLREDRRAHPNDSELYAIDASTGELTQLTSREGPDGSPVFDASTGTLFWTGFDDRRQGHQQNEIHARRGALDPEAPSQILTADLDRIPGSLRVDGGTLYFTYGEEGRTQLARVTGDGIETMGIELHGIGSGRPYSGGQYDIAGGTLAYVGGDKAWPGELHVRREGGEATRVTDVNGDLRRTVKLGEVTPQWTESGADGQRVQSWIITPPDFEEGAVDEAGAPLQHPLILEIHGGPFLAYGPQFSFELQLMAAHGYVVVYGNPRGSTTYGETFANRIHHAYPSQDYDDLMSMVDGALAKGFVDPERLYVTGGSGGGVLTAWIVGKTDRFAAAVVAKPVINWISFVLTADAYDFFWQYWFPKAPWDAFEQYWARSPLSLVGNVSTPTMLLTGEQDFRTPISESEQYYQALKIRGVDTAFVRVPGAGHGIARRPSHLIGKVLHILAWFDRYAPVEEGAKKDNSDEK